MQELILNVCKALDGIEPNDIDEALKNVPQFQDIKNLEAKVNFLIHKDEDLKVQVVAKKQAFGVEEEDK